MLISGVDGRTDGRSLELSIACTMGGKNQSLVKRLFNWRPEQIIHGSLASRWQSGHREVIKYGGSGGYERETW